MNRQSILKSASLIALLVLIPIFGCTDTGNRSDGRLQGPPPEAIKACEGHQVGDSVEFTGRRGETLKGICKKINNQLAAAPEGMPPEDGKRQ